MSDPFLIDGPAVISFSGGRTSGYMLRQLLDAHGGTLPADTHVMFANTGKEMPQTLDFVEECSQRWSVPITWVEYRPRKDDRSKDHAVVDYATASRQGEPYEYLIEERKFLPNVVARFCTVELKIRPMHRVLFERGLTEWTSYVGIRADEPRRIAKLHRQDYGKHEVKEAPLVRAKVTAKHVGEFWRAQPFDLGLPNIGGKTLHGNCDLCFLKGPRQVLSLIRENPERAVWWMNMEAKASALTSGDGGYFRNDRPSYGQMRQFAINQSEMFVGIDSDDIEDCACTD